LKIWIQSSAFLATPPPSTGGLETVVAEISAALAARGHEVTLFALQGSHIDGVRVVQVAPFRRPYDTETAVVDLMERERQPDVLFDHSLYQLAQARWPNLPAVTQSHGWVKMPAHARNPVFCSRHHGQSHGVADPQVALINVQPADYALGGPMAKRGPALFLGRIVPYKRVELAIALCVGAGVPLVVAGPQSDAGYFTTTVEPLIRESVQYVGELAGEQKARHLANACCLMFTSEPQEPSGTVMLEAMAAGTPVFAYDHGANPEYIVHGRTGFLWKDDDQFIAGLARRCWLDIDPAACRQYVETTFSPAASADRIEALLQRAAKGERW
jgi:glycosyltransferase involved in cell wall biosynthesis